MTDTKTLRKGWTTGACATAAATAAAHALRTGVFPSEITITLPKGLSPTFEVVRTRLKSGVASASVIKDAGDDPDVTHGAEIRAEVKLGGTGVSFCAGEGVGTVTRPGLPLAVGEPAINPGPRAMITDNIGEGDFIVTLSVIDGVALAEKTLNSRLGIMGGLSILGTTGVVVPYSCSAWIDAVHRGVDVARASGLTHIAACTGRTSEEAVKKQLELEDTALVEMGDFAGALLKYLRKHPVDKLTIGGGFAKLAKLAQGEVDLHSSRSRLDMNALATLVEEAGGDIQACETARHSASGGAVLEQAQALALPLADIVAKHARDRALTILSGDTKVEVLVYDRQGEQIGHAP